MHKKLSEILQKPAFEAAPLLLGCILEREVDGMPVRVKIVETEAYDETDAASHSYKGKTPRTDVMFGEAGHLYVYFTYGMHYCCNVVTGKTGTGSAVLIRAVEPIEGELVMQRFRQARGVQLSNGPAKLCQALAIDTTMNGHDLANLPMRLVLGDSVDARFITRTKRVGISKNKDLAWRFYITNSPYVSKV